MKRVLIIDDDGINAEIIRHYLEKTGEYETVWAENASSAIDACRRPVDVILLDIMLPDVNGVELCRTLRSLVYCPILFISCIDDEDTVIRALETGGDDYLVKPFSNKMLLARIQANLRRIENTPHEPELLRLPHFCVNTGEHTLMARGQLFHLSSIEYDVLMYIIKHPCRTISLDEIYESVWNAPSHGDVRTVISHIYNLRKKIEIDPKKPQIIRSVRGFGYYFSPDGAAR